MKRMSMLLAGLLLAAVATGCMSGEAADGFNAINADRAGNGVGTLGEHGDLVAKAEGWAAHLANASGGRCGLETLVHSNLKDGAPGGWQNLGENVGCRIATSDIASNVGPLEVAFMNSPHHRENILNGWFNKGGVAFAAVPAAGAPGMLAVYEVQEFARV
jgi:uncharacterized protein YkwD